MIKFIYKNEDGDYIQMKVDDMETWGVVVEKFQEFLKSVGYVFSPKFDMVSVLETEHRLILDEEADEKRKCNGKKSCPNYDMDSVWE
jgi:hypothetical protein